MKEEKFKDGRTSERDTINPDGTINHVLQVQNCKIDVSEIFRPRRKSIREIKEKHKNRRPLHDDEDWEDDDIL